MAGVLRVVGRVVAGLVAAVVVTAGVAWSLGGRKLARRYDAPFTRLAIPTDSASIARGEHLVRHVISCTVCHGADLGGATYLDAGPMGVVAGANLTTGKGGIGTTRTDLDLVRAIRYGIGADSTSLVLMPSEVFTYLTDTDLGAVIAAIRHLPPVDREVPRSRFGALGRAMLGVGKFNILPAPKTPRLTPVASIGETPTVEYGRYLANVAGCHGCHGFGLSGGVVAGPPGLPPAANLTPAGIGSWSEEDFARALRLGKRRDGSEINRFMPWEHYAGMTDGEVRALWSYLRSVPAREFGNK